MKKITLIHCYSDQNRGDAGIIESTVGMFKERWPHSEFSAVSVFHEDDDRFKNDHYFTEKIVSKIYPALFYEPSIHRCGIGYSSLRKVSCFFYALFINLLLLVAPYDQVARFLLSDERFSTFKIIKESDLVVSKGGSFLYSQGGVSGEFFLFRMVFAFLLPLRMRKEVVIFSQSLGPFQGFAKSLLFYVIRRMKNVYVREEVCKKYLPSDIANSLVVIPDAAFCLRAKEVNLRLSERKKIAITARPHKFSSDVKVQEAKWDDYINSLKVAALHCLEKGYEVHLVGQVTGPSSGEDDRIALAELYHKIGQKDGVVFWSEKERLMSPGELQALYSKMEFLIGTRLHSSIFALGVNVPTINIAYHGTKSQGIMSSVGLGDFVVNIDEISHDEIVKLINEIIEYPTENIEKSVGEIKALLKMAINSI